MPLQEKVSGAEHPDTLVTRSLLAQVTVNLGDHQTAKDMLDALLPLREKVSGAEHPNTLNTRHLLARVTDRLKESYTANETETADV